VQDLKFELSQLIVNTIINSLQLRLSLPAVTTTEPLGTLNAPIGNSIISDDLYLPLKGIYFITVLQCP
jgi:hypothetical protein